MITFTFLTGLLGSLILVTGAALPDRKTFHPARSFKNWCFAIGGMVMFLYALLNYIAGGSVFFLFLQVLVNLSSVFMMLDIDDRIDTPIMATAALGLIIWSFWIRMEVQTLFFILGLCGIAIGYCSNGGTLRREIALMIGSALIALFSYITHTWIFFWLNVFFALFSTYYVWLGLQKNHRIFA